MDKIPTDLLGGCFRFFEEEIRFSTFPKKNKKKLEKDMKDLKSMLDAVTTIFQEQEQTRLGTECKVVVKDWLAKVNDIETEVKTHLDKLAESRSCTCCCSPRVNYLLGKDVVRLIEQVRRLVEERRSFDDDNLVSSIPKTNKKNLEREMEDLKRIRDVVSTKIREQERTGGTECKVEVKSWLDAVNDIDREVNTHLDKHAESSSSYHLGKEVVRLIEQIHKLVEERGSFDDDNLVRPIPPDPIDNVPDLPTTMVGRDGKSSEIQGYLRDSQVRTIGIRGMGGISKTTMLKSIKHWLSGNDHDFHYIIWIEMSQNDDDILKIQRQIAECLYLSLKPEHEEWKNARMLANALRGRKSLVLIDNVWKKLEFERIGIPFAVGNVKILFTTRSEIVCNDMRAQKIVSLDSLDHKESLQLFQGNINPDVDLTDMIVRKHVDEILKICGGVPLVIVTVARTVANYNRVELWDHAVECLRSSRDEIEGMDDVIKSLKFSYDALEDDKIKSCLLYLSLYPEGYQIYTDELIKEWIAEGILDTPYDNSFTRSYQRGVVNINKLKLICLVEKSVYSDERVKLHDEIRHMLCSIREHQNKEVFIVHNYNDDRWDSAKRICLLEGQLKGLPETGMPSCPNLTSLIVQAQDYAGNQIEKLPTEEFFHFTPSLRVLNLSWTGLVDIPKSIGELVELRYLNLSRTRIHTVPMELKNLKKLKCLNLGNTLKLVTIVGSAISQLSALQSLNLCNTNYQWNDVNMTTRPPLLKLEDLRALKNLEDLGVDVSSNSHLNTILCDQMLLKSIARISFIQINFTIVDLGGLQLIEWISNRLPKLMNLIVQECALATDILEIKDDQLQYVRQLNLWGLEMSSVTLNDASRPFSRLKVLQIFGCQRLKEVSWTARIPSLERLLLQNCNSVRELVEEEEEIREERHYFPKLYKLKIKDLENLERIHGRSPLLFPALRGLWIENCPKLKQLSFGDDSAKNMEFIKCGKIQWDSLEWENDRVQAKFSPYFHRIPDLSTTMVERDSLKEAESLQLFKTNISPDVDLTEKTVRQRVGEILKRCGGVPLVIVIVARTVANYTLVAEWDHAVECLRSYEGMDEVMKCLKFSYDMLEDDKIKSCLLYLSLYPEGYQIYTDKVIKQWVAEGFLDKDDTPNDNSFKRSYERGVVNINKLKSICLVEKPVYSDDEVKLHDEIRHMLCWIREHENKEVFIKYAEVSDCNYDRWDLAKRIFLREGQLKGLPEMGMPSCPNLTSLIVQAQASNRIDKLPTEEFFHFTPSLRVLNLSFTGLVDIPKSIGELVELRYLDLNGTLIETLPMELANLKKLKCLNLGHTWELVTIVASAISQLSALQSLNLCNTKYQWNNVNMTTQPPLLKLEDLRALKNLEDLGVDVKSNSHLDTILCDEKFLKSITRISFVRIDFTTIDLGELQLIEWISNRLPKLMQLVVDRCALATDILEIKDDKLQYFRQLNLWNLKISSVTLNDVSRPFSRVKVLRIFGCQRLKEVSWTARIPSLEALRVKNCNSVKELVEEEEEEEIREERHYFPKLYKLEINDLEKLERIHGRSTLLFPALRILFIENCPKLKQLSFGDDSAKNMEFIKCEKIQWDSLEWENDRVQVKFSPYVHY